MALASADHPCFRTLTPEQIEMLAAQFALAEKRIRENERWLRERR